MKREVNALLLSHDEDLLRALKQTLETLEIKTSIDRSYEHARILLEQPNPPELVFSDASLSGGTWSEVVGLAAKFLTSVHAIVVSRVADYKLYLDAMEGGAADFIMPPFWAFDIAHMIRCVRENTDHQQPARRVAAA